MLADMTATYLKRMVGTEKDEHFHQAMYKRACRSAVDSLFTVYFLPSLALPG